MDLLPSFQLAIDDLGKLLPRLSAVREGINLYGATSFSPFSIFSPDENTLSRVIAELFDPRGSHGQSLLFLNELLAAVGVARLNHLDRVKVRREVTTREKRRIDLVIETTSYVIGIENKPFAVQQHKQLEDYLEELKADLRGRRPILIFLSDQLPESAEVETICVPYFTDNEAISLHKILTKSSPQIKAEGPRRFVDDFARFIEVSFGGKFLRDESENIYVDAVVGEFDNPLRRKAISLVLLCQESLHTKILDEIGDYLLTCVKNQVNSDFIASCPIDNREPKVSKCLWVRYAPFGLRRPSWRINCDVAIETQGSEWLTEIIFGVRAPDIAKLAAKDKHYSCVGRPKLDGLTARIPGGRSTPYWPWYAYLAESAWTQDYCAKLIIESPTGAVGDHPDIQDLARQFVAMATEVDRLLSE